MRFCIMLGMTQEEIRLECLRVAQADGRAPLNEVLDWARQYYEFVLKGVPNAGGQD